jgi:alcohol dehydrogenase
MTKTVTAFVVRQAGERVTRGVEALPIDLLPAHEVTVQVAYSSLNYKDALAASGHPGIVKRFPHVPGIDAAGVVVDGSGAFAPGQPVIVTGFELGAGSFGGFAELIRVPASWVVPLPEGLSLREAMVLGTAGLTAALAVDALGRHGLAPEAGPVLVTGASGGVGSLAVALLSKLGYAVTASTGKAQAHALLRQLGANAILDRAELAQTNPRPLLSGRWAAAVDTVGGETLTNVVKSLQPGGAAAACGLVGGTELALSVYPFILRGVSLLGIDSANAPLALRQRLWQQLAGPWRLSGLDVLTHEVGLGELEPAIAAILNGELMGRTVVKL